MDLIKLLLDNTQSADKLGQAVGIDAQAANSVLEKLLPALSAGLQKNLQSGGGMEALAGALKGGNHQRYAEDPSALMTDAAKADGNRILGHILGGKDASRALASQVGAETGVDAYAIKKLLPMVAALAMGALSKKTDSGAQLEGGAGEVLSALLSSKDGDGGLSALLGLAKKFL